MLFNNAQITNMIDISSISIDLITRISEEECAELIQAISKESRGKADRDNTNEEIADVLICISWLIQKLNLDENEINKWIEFKTNRSKNKIEKNNFK